MQTRRNIKAVVTGRVQGVGFRYFVMRHARAAGLAGYVCNLPDGRVEFQLHGESGAIDRVLERIRRGPDYARVDDMQLDETDAIADGSAFTIRQ